MAINFVARKCACGGKLEFDPSKKIWICKYCGTIVEREATFDKIQVDGIEGINDVVRQTLMDIANKRMESAKRNLEECERKDHNHIGTLLANLSFQIMSISTAKSQEEARGALDKVKVYAKRLSTEFPTVAESEINLYESFGQGASDIYANLLAIFDTLNDTGRIEYVASKLDAGEVFSEYANKSLLKIAIKHGKDEVVETIINNKNHIDKKAALEEILNSYPDCEAKAGLVKKLFDERIADELSKSFFENYFINSKDSIGTKNELLELLTGTELHCNAEIIVKALFPQMDTYDAAKKTFLAIYKGDVNDLETEAIVIFVLIVNKNYDVLMAFLNVVIEQQIFVTLSSRTVISFLDSSSFAAIQKKDIINRMFHLEIDGRARDAIYNYYLNQNSDSIAERDVLIGELLSGECTISTNTVRNYVINTTIDKEKKRGVLEQIFATGFNKTFVGDLLSEYLLKGKDDKLVRDEVTDYLISLGFKVDANTLTEFIVSGKDEVSVTIERVKKLLQNGSQIKLDCLERYLLSLNNPDDFSEEMFNLLTESNFSVGISAFSKYLLSCKDIDKERHSNLIISCLGGNLAEANVTVIHLGNTVVCNLFQAFVLCGNEKQDVAVSVTNDFKERKIKLNTEIFVNDKAIKFKKYVAEHKSELSPESLQLCEENKMFSLF